MARRGAWVLGSTALQTAIVAGIVSVSSALAARVANETLVPVKLVRPAAPMRPAPPPPPPAPQKRVATKPKVETPQKPRVAMIQPKELPQELKPPDPTPPEPEDEGSDEGVEGGVIGGVVGGEVPSGPAAGPIKFNASMTPPVLVSGPPVEYTQQALEREIEGLMQVECIVTVQGAVHHCRVLKSLPFMDRAVVDNLERRRYKPATLGGKPLDVDYTFTIRLKLPQ